LRRRGPGRCGHPSVSRGDSLLQRLLGQGVDALAFGLRDDSELLVQFRGNAKIPSRSLVPARNSLAGDMALHLPRQLHRDVHPAGGLDEALVERQETSNP